MARLSRIMGNRDMPWETLNRIPGAAAGSGTDYEVPLLYVPDLTKVQATFPTGASGDTPNNNLYLRDITLTVEAALTGAATNYFAWNVRQWRAGAALSQYSLSSVTAISAGANTITVTQGALVNVLQNVQVGQLVFISGGVGTAEYVVITGLSIPNGTITFTAVNTHSGAYTIVCTQLVGVIYSSSGVTETTLVPHQLLPIPHSLKAGDLVTLQRQSFGTGLASPNVNAFCEYDLVTNSPANPGFRA